MPANSATITPPLTLEETIVKTAVVQTTVVFLAVMTAGCPSYHLRYKPCAQVPDPPAEWKNVQLESVELAPGTPEYGPVESTGHHLGTVFVEPGLSHVLAAGLERRIGRDAGKPVSLRLRNVRAVVDLNEGFGLSGQVCLAQESRAPSCFGVEHSVTVRGYFTKERWEEEVLARAVEDFSDRVLSNPTALEFLGAESTPYRTFQDSALLDRNANVGRVHILKPREQGYDTSGRVLWAPGDLNMGAGALVTLGDVKGGMAATTTQFGGSWYLVSALTAFGGFKLKDPEQDTSTTVLMNWSFLAMLVGTNQTVKDYQGYVHSPGLSFLVGPEALAVRYFSSKFDFNVIEAGGMLLVDTPLVTRSFGLTAGYWAGVGEACISAWGGDAGYGAWCSDPLFLHAPIFDLWIRSGGNKFNLGLQFLALAAQDKFDVEQLWKNPSFMFTWTRSHGRGAGAHDTSVLLKGSELYGHSEDLATPVNVFERK